MSVHLILSDSLTHLPILTQGDQNELYPIKHAEHLSSQLTGVEDGVILYSVKGKVHPSAVIYFCFN